MKLSTVALIAIGFAGVAGCDVYVHPPAAAVEVDAGAPVAYDSFYLGGHYDGDFWVWRDHEGHFFRERRAVHEHRLSERARVEHHETVRHEEVRHEEEHH
ncbi:MAG TPA: hypothetical protein VFE47_05120 [Tepidisphaeraceae bacterium]|jgi:hypothetical protein|nr:hypothetical protein [Tepidisphaeraceae bacterium]